MSSSPSKPLSTRDINTTSPSPTTLKASHQTPDEDNLDQKSSNQNNNNNNKAQSMEYHRQVLQNRLEEDKAQRNYVSPSDTIMSPCTAKLSAYKSKQFGKATKPQSLFAKMEASKKQAEAAKAEERKDGGGGGGAD